MESTLCLLFSSKGLHVSSTRRKIYLAVLLLILFLVARCLLGQQVQGMTPKEAAVKHMERVGAILTKDEQGRVVALQFPEHLGLNEQGWPHLSNLTDLRDLDLGALALPNEAIRYLKPLTELRSLNLFGNPIDSIALKNIEGMQKLETLYLYRTFVDDVGTESIAKLKNLKRLNMFDTFLTDRGLDQLGTCSQLRYLSLGNSKAGNFPESFFTEPGLARLRKNLNKTEISHWSADRLDTPKIFAPADEAAGTRAAVAKTEMALAPTKVLPVKNLGTRNQGSDWPFFLGLNGDGKSSDQGIQTQWSTNPPKLLWHRKIGTGFAAPTISLGRLMIYHRVRNEEENDAGGGRFVERLSCLNAETGDEIWQVDFPTNYQDLNGYGDGPRSAATIDGNRVYLLSPAGVLRCLQVANGQLIWEVDLPKAYGSPLATYGMGSTPVVYKNRLLVIAGQGPEKTAQMSILSLDKRTGVFQYGVGDHLASYATPVVRESMGRPWCFSFTQNGLIGFHPDTGEQDFDFAWRANIAGCVNASTPVVDGNQVFISESYRLGGAKLQFAAGQSVIPVWQDSRRVRQKSLAMHWATPILHEGYLYGCSGRHSSNGVLKCVEWATGRTVWKESMPDRTSLTYIDGHFLNFGENGLLTLIKATPNGFQEVARLGKGNAEVVPSYPAWSAPVVAQGLLYLRGKHELICYELVPLK